MHRESVSLVGRYFDALVGVTCFYDRFGECQSRFRPKESENRCRIVAHEKKVNRGVLGDVCVLNFVQKGKFELVQALIHSQMARKEWSFEITDARIRLCLDQVSLCFQDSELFKFHEFGGGDLGLLGKGLEKILQPLLATKSLMNQSIVELPFLIGVPAREG
jgi:hypothetical protein